MKQETSYQLLTFYAFVDIPDAKDQVALHKQFCGDIGMM
jgi:predicted sulfurtransferase